MYDMAFLISGVYFIKIKNILKSDLGTIIHDYCCCCFAMFFVCLFLFLFCLFVYLLFVCLFFFLPFYCTKSLNYGRRGLLRIALCSLSKPVLYASIGYMVHCWNKTKKVV